jgi:protein O-GlcNAc transferase
MSRKRAKANAPKRAELRIGSPAAIERLMADALEHYQAGKLAEAEILCRKILAVQPAHMTSLNILGAAACQAGKLEEGVAWFRRAVTARPDDPRAYVNLGNALNELRMLDDAAASYRRAVELDPNSADAINGLGTALRKQGHLAGAVTLYRRAIGIRENYAEAYNGLGNAFLEEGKLDEAVQSYGRAIAIRPDYADAEGNLGIVLQKLGRIEEAIASYRRTLSVRPDHAGAFSGLVREKRRSCDWSDYVSDERRLKAFAIAPTGQVDPFNFLTSGLTPQEQSQCARKWASSIAVPPDAIVSSTIPRPGGRARIGYLSADFRQHPIAYVTAELFERHDRSRFEVNGYSCGVDDGSGIRRRLIAGFDRFVDIRSCTDLEAAHRIRDEGIDILVDLNGYTEGGRMRMLAHRPAPIQVHYLGFPATLGATFIDYILVDSFVVPPEQQPLFAEKLVHLPYCFFVNDSTRAITVRTPSRTEYGLPESGFVYCSFNNLYKLTPAIFDIWMGCLRATSSSVLWLRQGSPATVDNLRREAGARGVAPERLVFAPRCPELSDHLARHRLADLFLDTLPYNAHTTACDALWAGLPVLTCTGSTFAGRVAASMLYAIGLPELVTTGLHYYDALARRLVREPTLLAGLRERLARNRLTTPLFDTGRFTRHVEAAYDEMLKYRDSGLKPTPFAVPASAS